MARHKGRRKREDGSAGVRREPAAEPAQERPGSAGGGRRWWMVGAATLALGAGVLGWNAMGRARRPNLLLVTIDTLRADHVGAYGYGPAATPALDALAARGVRFENARSASPLTGPSHATLLTGQYPPSHGVRENVNFILDPGQRTLAERLKAAGFETAAFIGAYPVGAAFGFGRGYDLYDEHLRPNPGIGQGAERPGNEVADAAVEWLTQRRSKPFFAWVHFYDPHLPYAPPAPFRETFADRPYDGEIAFTDAQLARVLAALRQSGAEPQTLVAVLSDHGEGLGEHGEQTHGLLLYDSTLRVPFLLAGPGVPRGQRVEASVGTADLVPTLLPLLGLPGVPELPGRDLGSALAGQDLPDRPLYAEALFGRLNCRWAALRGWVQGDWKLVEGGETELFDVASDPMEQRNLAGRERERVERMRRALAQAVDKMAPGGDRPRPFTLSPDQAERLASLGYTAGSGGAGPIDDPSLPDPRPRVAWLERLQGLQGATGPAIDPAIREVGAILENDRENPFGLFVLGSLAYRGGHLSLAEKAFARTLELDPERPVMRQYYGALLRDLGQIDASERELRIAVAQAAADDYITQVELAETLIANEKQDEAERLLRGILEKQPSHAKAVGALGRLLLRRGRLDEALPKLEEAGERGEAEPLLELAAAYLRLGRSQDAQRAAARVLERSPAHPWALGLNAHALVLQGQRDEALAMLRRAVAIGPRRPTVWLAIAAAYEAAGERAEAERCRRSARAAG